MITRIKNLCFISLLVGGFWFVAQGSYIHIKAQLAQFLLETAWSKTSQGNDPIKPWPWADTWPVARLAVPALDINHIVLAGANGATLAFGPGRLFNNQSNAIILSGHRDTHFDFLDELKIGELIRYELPGQPIQSFKVFATQIINTEEINTIPSSIISGLILITCYPFDTLQIGGPLRYLVYAEPSPAITI
ncbi:MAG: class GN sortase [Pseudomonadota bacterium]